MGVGKTGELLHILHAAGEKLLSKETTYFPRGLMVFTKSVLITPHYQRTCMK